MNNICAAYLEQKIIERNVGKYIDSVKNNLRAQLNNVTIVNPDGTTRDLGKEMAAKERKKGH